MRSSVARAVQPVLPFVGTSTLALAATLLRVTGTDWALVASAAATAAVVAVVGCLSPWSRAVRVALPLLPFAVDGVLGLLRQAQGGSTSGYAPLAVLPVVWVALTQRQVGVAAISACTTALFAVPIIVIGAPLYPGTGWRGVALWALVAIVVAVVVQRIVAQQRNAAALLATRAAGLDRLLQAQAAISVADPDLERVMTVVASEGLAIAGGDGACVELLDGDEVVCSAAAGTAVGFVGMRLKADESLTGACFRSGKVLVCTDSEDDPRAAREACRAVGARSLVLVPLVHGAVTKAVLIVWSGAAHDFAGHKSQVLALLANTSAAAMVRAELISQLRAQALTDELTGLPNRRAWHARLQGAMARSRRSSRPLSVLALDLDDFKEVNDLHGHAAGDQVLKEVSRAWGAALRDADMLGRLGGDEFAVVLEDTDEAAALGVIARLSTFTGGQSSASIGHAVWDGAQDADALLAVADARMYERKYSRAAT